MSIATIQQKAAEAKKSIVAFSAAALAVVAVLAPNYSDEAAWAVGALVAVLGGVATYRVENQIPADGAVGFNDSGPSA